MANKVFNSGAGSSPEMWLEQPDGTFAQRVATVSVDPTTGTAQTALPPGRAAAASSVPVVLSTEDFARVSQTYRRATAVGTAGDAVIVTGVTTAGTVTFTLATSGTVTVSVPLGTSIFPFSVTAAALGTAVGGTFQSLFFS